MKRVSSKCDWLLRAFSSTTWGVGGSAEGRDAQIQNGHHMQVMQMRKHRLKRYCVPVPHPIWIFLLSSCYTKLHPAVASPRNCIQHLNFKTHHVLLEKEKNIECDIKALYKYKDLPYIFNSDILFGLYYAHDSNCSKFQHANLSPQ